MSELDRASLDRTLPPRSGSADWDEVLRDAGREGTPWTTPCGRRCGLARPRRWHGLGLRHRARPLRQRDARRRCLPCHGRQERELFPPRFFHHRRRRQPIAALADRGCARLYGPVRASHRARTVCRTPPDQDAEVVARTPRGLRDPPGRSDAARRDHREGWPAGRVRAHPATARDSEARLRHGEHHAQVSQGGAPSPEPLRTPPANSRTCRSRTRCSSCILLRARVTEG